MTEWIHSLNDDQREEFESWYGDIAEPIPLAHRQALKCKTGYVYFRKWGVFHTAAARHPILMSMLWCFSQDVGVVNEYQNVYKQANYADLFLQQPGTCYKSSLSKSVQCWNRRSLNTMEKDYFSPLEFLSNE